MMKYLICYTWNNTRGNHAGFTWICRLLQKMHPLSYKVITEYSKEKRHIVSNVFLNRCLNAIDRRYRAFTFGRAINRMMRSLRDDDEVYLMNYFFAGINQMSIASMVKKIDPNRRVLAMVHLTPSLIESTVSSQEKKDWTKLIDGYLTLGSSLTYYLENITAKQVPIYTLFHPVDANYFKPILKNENTSRLNVIFFGNLQRNYAVLEEIICNVPEIHFTICAGFHDCTFLNRYDNVTVQGYMPEDKLREQLSKADISLNVMDDTVGSNVITISMAMGLAIIVSDVGSIRDYCTEKNAFFCKSTNDYIEAIHHLANHRNLLDKMKEESLRRSKLLSIERFHEQMNLISKNLSHSEIERVAQ